jgi:hypothetical protein
MWTYRHARHAGQPKHIATEHHRAAQKVRRDLQTAQVGKEGSAL